jgi:hypothetical protein
MSVAAWLVVVLAAVAVVGVVVWMFVTHTPEQAATHQKESEPPSRLTDELAKGVDRPADPNAEAQGPMVGDARPGPTGPASAPVAGEVDDTRS